jgi:hypothetical protein
MRPYMSEEEAKGKGCPLRKHTNHDTVNRVSTDDYMMACQASACMWWGWEELWEYKEGEDTRISPTQGRCEAPGGVA